MFEGFDVSQITRLLKIMNGGNINPTELVKMLSGGNNPQTNQLMQLLPLLLANGGNLNGIMNNSGFNNKGKPNTDLPQKDDFAYELYKLSQT